MTQANPFTTETDRTLERRRALAKVYSLLLRLAEEAEQASIVSNTTPVQERTDGIPQTQNNEIDPSKTVIL